MNPPKEILQIPVEDIIPNRFQPRISFDEKALDDLASSIKEHGIIQPLVVRRLGNKYEIVAGERRYKASLMVGLTSVPAIISEIDDKTSAEVALVENVQRKDLTAIEEARSYKSLMDKNQMTQEEVAKKMGLSQSTIANKLRLLNLSLKVQTALLNEQISERHARSLLVLSSEEEQNSWLDKILNERLTVRQLDTMLKQDNVLDEEDVPLVNINQSIEDIKSNATDIISSNEIEEEKPISTGRKFFNIIEETPKVNSAPNEYREIQIPSFEVTNQPSPNEEEKEHDIFEDVELLDINEHEISNDSNITKIINEIREKINLINTDNNIEIEEFDLDGSYKINITINKE